MRTFAISGLAMVLLACGGPEWNGTFVGSLSQSGTCSDGSSVPATDTAVKVTLRDDGDTVTWNAACGATAIADVDEDMAQVRQYSCPAQTSNDGTTTNVTVEGGTLTLDDNTLRMDLDFALSLSGTVTGTCDVTTKGSLSRLEE